METNKVKSSNLNKKGFLIAFIFFNLIVFLILFVILELIFRIAGLGYSTEPFIKPKYLQDYYIENPYFTLKYSDEKSSKDIPLQDISRCLFTVKKQTNHLRGFVLGGSSVQGYPFQSLFSFPAITEAILNSVFTNKKFELINLGYTAVSSFYVTDAAAKLLKYDPDFIIIYTGHNEYYGTYSYTTGGNYLSKKISLFLKEFRVYQWLSSILSTTPIKNKTTLSKRYNDIKIKNNVSIDENIANQYIANINKVLKIYSRKGIPVFVIEPVCNLIDMPPFSGEYDEELKDQIKEYWIALLEKKENEISNLFQYFETNKLAKSNANVLFLNALKMQKEKVNNYIDHFIKAKDMDIIPFRVKDILIDKLHKFYKYTSSKYSNFYYIPLFDKLTNAFGEGILGNDIFVDHVHFNNKGHIFVSQFLSESLANYFGFQDVTNNIYSITTNSSRLAKLIYYLPAYELQAYLRIGYLFIDTPYKEMLIPYKVDTSPLRNNELVKNKDFQKVFTQDNQIKALSTPEYLDLLLNFYSSRNDTDSVLKYLLSFNKMYPAAVGGNINLGIFYASQTTNSNLAIEYFSRAYYLSEKSQKVSEIYKMYFPQHAKSIK